MDNSKRWQILFRENITKEYPHIAKFFTELTGNDRARALMSCVEAFISITNSGDSSARSISCLAESYRCGWRLNKDNPVDKSTLYQNDAAPLETASSDITDIDSGAKSNPADSDKAFAEEIQRTFG